MTLGLAYQVVPGHQLGHRNGQRDVPVLELVVRVPLGVDDLVAGARHPPDQSNLRTWISPKSKKMDYWINLDNLPKSKNFAVLSKQSV